MGCTSSQASLNNLEQLVYHFPKSNPTIQHAKMMRKIQMYGFITGIATLAKDFGKLQQSFQ